MGLATQGRHWLGSTGELETRGREQASHAACREETLRPGLDSPSPLSLQSPCLNGQIEEPELVSLSCLPSCYLWVQLVLHSQDVQEGRSLLQNQTYIPVRQVKKKATAQLSGAAVKVCVA